MIRNVFLSCSVRALFVLLLVMPDAFAQSPVIETIEFVVDANGKLVPSKTPGAEATSLAPPQPGSGTSDFLAQSNNNKLQSFIGALKQQDFYVTKSADGIIEGLTAVPFGVAPPASVLTQLSQGSVVEKASWNQIVNLFVPSEEQIREGYNEAVNRTVTMICATTPRPREISPSFTIQVGAGLSGSFGLTATFDTEEVCSQVDAAKAQ